jgi:hypothetical protein
MSGTLAAMPRPRDDRERLPLGLRLSSMLLKPAAYDEDETEPLSLEELTIAAKSADDKERMIGFLAAPIAAFIAILITSSLVGNDPSALLKSGLANIHHVSLSLYYELGGVILGLSVLMLVTAMLRKRLFLGIAMALYGLAVFNLHFWGFGVPFILAAAWLLVRAYRLQRELKLATDAAEASTAGRVRFGAPQPSKRYTPPAASRRR